MLVLYITLIVQNNKKYLAFVALTSLTRHIDHTMKLGILEMPVKKTSHCICSKHLSETLKLYSEHKNLILSACGFTEDIAPS